MNHTTLKLRMTRKNILMTLFVIAGTASSIFGTNFQNNSDTTVTLQGPRGRRTIQAGQSDSFTPLVKSLTFTVAADGYNTYSSGQINRNDMPANYVITIDANNNIVLTDPTDVTVQDRTIYIANIDE